MSLLTKFIKSVKGNNFRIVENPVKYVGYFFAERVNKSNSRNAKSGVSNLSATATSTDTGNNP
jgi:hypothetical protein